MIYQRATTRRRKRCAMSWSYLSRTKGFPKPRVGGYGMPDFHHHMKRDTKKTPGETLGVAGVPSKGY